MSGSVFASYSVIPREPHARLKISPLAEIGLVLLLVALTWFLIAV